MLRHKALSTELTEVGLSFLLRWRSDLNNLLNLLCLLLVLLGDLNCWLLDNLLLDLSLLLRLWLRLLVNLNLLMLLIPVRWTLENLIDHFPVRGDDLNWHWWRWCTWRGDECGARWQIDWKEIYVSYEFYKLMRRFNWLWLTPCSRWPGMEAVSAHKSLMRLLSPECRRKCNARPSRLLKTLPHSRQAYWRRGGVSPLKVAIKLFGLPTTVTVWGCCWMCWTSICCCWACCCACC